jgi:hypothetical protein
MVQVTLLAFCGLLSGLATAALAYKAGLYHAHLLLGGAFGLLVAACLFISGAIGSVWRAVLLILVATLAYALSVLVAFAFQGVVLSTFMTSSQESAPSPIALFVGGALGGFLILSEAVFLPRIETKKRAFKLALLWSLVGGTLGVVGSALGPTLGTALWGLVRALHLTAPNAGPQDWLYGLTETRRLYSLYVVWQTGMAFVLGVLLRRYEPKPHSKHMEQP